MITRAFAMKKPGHEINYGSMVKTSSDEHFGLFIQEDSSISEDYSTSPEIPIWMGPNEEYEDSDSPISSGLEGSIIVAGIVTQRNYPEQGEVPGMPPGGDRGEVHFWRYKGEGPGLGNITFFNFLYNCFKTNWAINSSEFGSNPPTINVSAIPTVGEYTNLFTYMREYGMWTNHPYWYLFSGDITNYDIDHIRNPNFGTSSFWLSNDIYNVMMPA